MDRAICIGDIVTEELRNLLGNRNFISGALAIGTTKSKVNLAAAIDYSIDGQIYHKAITNDCFTHTDLTVQAADTTKWYALCINAAGTGSIVQGTATQLPKIASTLCIVGAIKIVTVAVTFTPATTLHDAAGVTTTYYNLSCVPTSGLPA